LGILIDRVNRTRLTTIFAVLAVCANVATAFAPNFVLVLVARGLAGVAALAMVPIAYSLVPDLYPPDRRGGALVTITVGQIIGNSLAFAVGGLLLAISGGWRPAMLWTGMIACPIVLALTLLREPRRGKSAGGEQRTDQVLSVLSSLRGAVAPITIAVCSA